jgi:uncharacterized protein
MHLDPNRRIAACLLAAFAAAGAHAASFDCKAAKTPTEKTICASPELSALDEKLAADYARALHALSPAGAARLKDSQRSWLRFAKAVCVPLELANRDEPPASCLEAEFRARLQQLAQAGVRVGPYLFNRIDFYESSPARAHDGGNHGGFVTQHVAFPQIDAPINAATTAWNAAQRKEDPGPLPTPVDPDGLAEDDDSDYTLGCAGERFISLRLDGSQYQHGAAHGSYDHQVRNTLMAPAPRDMTASDIFAPGAPWKARLPPLFWAVHAKDPDVARDIQSIKDAIEAAAADPTRWLLTPEGLQIAFDADEAGCHACNPGPLTVPWPAVKAMLAAPDLASCKAPPAAHR